MVEVWVGWDAPRSMPDDLRSDRHLLVAIGDIHGRFRRLQGWSERLSAALPLPIRQGLAVGDVEAFRDPDDQRRKATKRVMPAEFAAFADGAASLDFPLAFVGGNNEDFETLAGIPEGGELAPGISFLGRSGVVQLAGLKIAYLSGIHAPRFYDAPLLPPRDAASRKHAGYFRRAEVERLARLRRADVLVLHEWPRGLIRSGFEGGPSPWMGNPISRSLCEKLRPAWVLCGHGHRAWASEWRWSDGTLTRVACLDELTSPEQSLLWMEVDAGHVTRVGFGFDPRPAWEEGRAWGPWCLPESPPKDEAPATSA